MMLSKEIIRKKFWGKNLGLKSITFLCILVEMQSILMCFAVGYDGLGHVHCFLQLVSSY